MMTSLALRLQVRAFSSPATAGCFSLQVTELLPSKPLQLDPKPFAGARHSWTPTQDLQLLAQRRSFTLSRAPRPQFAFHALGQ